MPVFGLSFMVQFLMTEAIVAAGADLVLQQECEAVILMSVFRKEMRQEC